MAIGIMFVAGRAQANEFWVAPSSQQDLGGLEVANNSFWPVTPLGAVRFTFAVPGDQVDFLTAKIGLIPGSLDSGATLNILVCQAQNGDAVKGTCVGPLASFFNGAANQLAEVDISAALGPHAANPGTYLAVLAYTVPNTATDHIVGLRYSYRAPLPTLADNTFYGTQTAPSFVGSFTGNGAGLTNLPIPAGAATLGANTFTGTQTAPGFAGSGTALTGIAKLTANTFTGTQTISTGNLVLDASTATTGNLIKGGHLFLHSINGLSTYLGQDAGASITTGYSNTGIGSSALQSDTAGAANTAVGATALFANTTGVGNTALGWGALQGNTSGTANVAIGEHAGGNQTTGSNNIYLGFGTGSVAGESGTMYLGWADGTWGGPFITRAFIGGVRGTTTGVANAVPVVIDSNGQLGTVSSSRRFKEDVHDMADASRRLFGLRPVTFRYRQPYRDGSQPVQFGLVAEEVAGTFPELAVRDADGNVETVHYETLNVLLLNEVQRQEKRIEALERQLETLLEHQRP